MNPGWWRRLFGVLRSAAAEWLSHRAASKGAALAFYTLFSLAPVLIVVIAVAGAFYGAEAARGELYGQLRGLLGSQGAEAIQLIVRGARNHKDGALATALAFALLLFGATTAFAELKDSLDEIWDLPPPPHAGWWDAVRTRLLSFGLVLVLAFLLMVSLVVSAGLSMLENVLGGGATVLSWLASVISFLVIAVLFGVIYKLLPRMPLAWRDVVVGALGTAVLFALGKFAIGAYIGNSGVVSSYGAAGSLIAVLMWVYYSAQIFFLGAEFARQYALQMGSLRGRAARPASPSPPPVPPPPSAPP